MSLDLILFGLRIVSMLLLLALLGFFFRVIWLDYRLTTQQQQRTARHYGRLVQLMLLDGHYQETNTVFILRPLTTIGRSPTSAIVIDDTFASMEHALITLRDGQWWLEDRNSRNGTLLNNSPVPAPVIITAEDVIGIGNLRFRLYLNE